MQLFTFMLGGERYGIDLLRVEQIQVWEQATRLPNTPTHIRGVTNLRGKIVPIIDARARFGLPKIPLGPRAAVVYARVGELGINHRIVGLLVDEVADVRDLVEPIQSHGHEGDDECIEGIAKCGELMVLVIAIDALIAFTGRRGPPLLAVA